MLYTHNIYISLTFTYINTDLEHASHDAIFRHLYRCLPEEKHFIGIAQQTISKHIYMQKDLNILSKWTLHLNCTYIHTYLEHISRYVYRRLSLQSERHRQYARTVCRHICISPKRKANNHQPTHTYMSLTPLSGTTNLPSRLTRRFLGFEEYGWSYSILSKDELSSLSGTRYWMQTHSSSFAGRTLRTLQHNGKWYHSLPTKNK